MVLEDFFALSVLERCRAGLSEHQAAALVDPETAATAQRWADELARNKIQVIHLSVAYPVQIRRVLGKVAPPILAAGEISNCWRSLPVGWCGSRHASAQGIDFTKATVEQAVEREITVVSGAARGIDTAAHHTALAYRAAQRSSLHRKAF